MADLGSIQILRNWINQFYTANGQQLITGQIGNAGLQNLLDTLVGIINTTFGQTAPMIADSANALKGGVQAEGNTLGKLYNLILALETTDFKDTFTSMTGTIYETNKLIVVKNAADGPDVESGAALYFFNNNTFEFLAGYDAINFTPEPAGADREIQYNNAGATAGDANLKWDDVLGLLLGANKPISLHGGSIRLVPITVDNKSQLLIRIDDTEIGKLSKTALELYGSTGVAHPRIQHPATDNEPMFVSSGDTTTGLGFIYNITEAKWIPAFFVAGIKTFEVHQNYLLLQDNTRIATAGNVVELVPPDNKIKTFSIGKADNRFNLVSVLVGDAEDGEAGIIIDFRGISYSADLSGLNALNENWLTSKKYVDAGDASSLTTIKGGVPVAGDNLKKLYDLIQGINTLLQSDDVTLDQVQEIVTYIKANKALLDEVTIGKVNVNDIINNLTSDDTNKPLSAAQGKALKALVDGVGTNYVHPATHPATIIEQDATHRFSTDAEKASYAGKADPAQITTAVNALKDNVPVAGDTLRKLFESLQTLQALVTSDDVNLDTVQEIVTFIKSNQSVIDQISTNKVNISDIVDNLLSVDTARPLSAKQGNVLKGLIDALALVVENKVDKIAGKGLSTNDYSTAEKNKLNGIEENAQVNTVTSVNDKTGAVVLNKADINLSLVDNTPDNLKEVSIPQQNAINAALQGQATMSALYAYYSFI